jgi:hypothetical protein
MAEVNLTSGERREVYQRIALLNRSFNFILLRLEELSQTRIFHQQHMKDMRGLVNEIQVEVNAHLLNSLHSIELEDWYRFGQARIQRDNRLNPGKLTRHKAPK